VAPQKEAAESEILNLGTTLDVLVHIIALLKKVIAIPGEGEAVMAALEEEAPSALWDPQEPTSCPLRGLHRMRETSLNQRILAIHLHILGVGKMDIGQRLVGHP
jgi:hypothetical protein